mmetsp:Transcript_1251/g.1595  ORF Transcript_1251/g.1595 Transcript_1251/m.1595 type:complete len:506 (-) Transcript_1251:46-1563(-)
MYPSSTTHQRVPSFFLDGDGTRDKPCVIGDASGVHGYVLAHDATTKETQICLNTNTIKERGKDLLPILRRELAKRQVNSKTLEDLGFNLGFVGYFGYGMRSQTRDYEPVPFIQQCQKVPDAAMLFSDRSLVLTDDGRALVLELVENNTSSTDGFVRMAQDALFQAIQKKKTKQRLPTENNELVFTSYLDEHKYSKLANEALERIAAGDSYEICLTTNFEARIRDVDPWLYYKRLRSANPAPRASFIDLRSACGVALCSSSPERFISLQPSGFVEAKPIKGTSPRIHENVDADRASAEELASSIKTRAENLMIADLLRNDLLRVCDHAHVSKLAAIESFATVHQLVTTLEGQLKSEHDAIDLIFNTFPPGSMTGAPKRRTCDIIAQLESQERGPYAGTFGFIGLDGRADLSVVIRSALFSSSDADEYSRITVGAGGALTALSDIHDEWQELLLKANAVIMALGGRIDLSSSAGEKKKLLFPSTKPVPRTTMSKKEQRRRSNSLYSR